jgi:hypothetical protein
MSKPFFAAVKEVFGDRVHVIDRFHVIQQAVNALDEVLRSVPKQLTQEEAKALKKLRKRYLVVDILGLLVTVLRTSAGLDAGVAASTLLGLMMPQALPRLVTICADQQDLNQALDIWMATHRTGWRLAVKGRPAGMRSGTPLEQRWVIERTNAWHGWYRRNSKDYGRTTA